MQVLRRPDADDLRDLTVAVRFEGDYDASYTDGDNRGVLPTDTMKNTVYALAAQQPVQEPESFGRRLAQHFLERNHRLTRVTIDLVEHLWGRLPRGDREHGHAFIRRGPDTRTAVVTGGRDRMSITAGADDVLILKSAHSAFAGFPRDEYTTLPETHERLLATSLTATWDYRDVEVDFGPAWHAVRRTLLDAFAEHHRIGAAHGARDGSGCARRDRHRRQHPPRDVEPSPPAIRSVAHRARNRNELFVATEEPHGLIAATLVR